VSPSYDFSNALPKLLNYRTAGLLTAVLGVLIQPWRLVSDPKIYIFTWLGIIGGVLGAVAGVLVAGYWIIDRTKLSLLDLYTPGGKYWFAKGWNYKAIVATVVGGVISVGGAYSAAGSGPFPENGVIPFLKPIYDYSWVAGFVAAIVVYVALNLPLKKTVSE
jgi:NCS1 family nucleobase:cation symporter-1